MSAEYLDHPRPLAFAHRGGAARQPENSLLAFENAARLGYAYLETDARSTADGKLIAFHDADLNRATDRTGYTQTATNVGTFPNGATGYHTVQINVV